MNAVLLSAGYGERLRPLTDDIPKCLLPATSKGTLLKYWIDLLDDLDINRIYLDICWQKEKIKRFINQQSCYIKNKVEIYEMEYLKPSGFSLHDLSNQLGDRYLIVNSDTFITKKGVQELINTDSKVFPVHLGVTFEDDVREGSLVSVQDGVVVSFTEKPSKKVSGYSYAGVMIMDNKITGKDSEDGMYGEITPDIVASCVGNISVCDVGGIIDIGRSVDGYYEAVEKIRRMENDSE